MNNSITLTPYASLAQLCSLQSQIAHYEGKTSSPLIQDAQICSSSRKISKKRSKYDKITDEIRLQLIDAVEKDGEMLKVAAKRFKINYSSAKSIFQTYRKEGRVLRKTNKTRRPPQDPLLKKDVSMPPTEESTSDKTQIETPTPENDEINLKPPKDFLSDGGVESLRILSQAQSWMTSQYLVNQAAMLEQKKTQLLLDSLLQRTSIPFFPSTPKVDVGLNQISQYYQMKQLGETMKMEAVNQLVRQMILSNMTPN